MICFPLDNTPYEAKDMGTYLATRTRGVFSSDGNLAVTPGESGLSVSVSPGLAWLKWSDYWGTAALQEQALTLALDTADGALKRIDAIVCRLDKVNNRAEIVVKKGAPSSAPIVVPPVRDANYDELYIATVLIGAGVISISASAITDQRLNEEYCGLMRDGVTGIPTASLHAQAQQILTELTATLDAQIVQQSSEFDAWFEDLKGKLGEDPATALQQQVDNLNAAAVGDSFKLKGNPISIEAAGANRIDSLNLYGETPQGGTTEAPVALTGVDSVQVCGNNLLPMATEAKTIYGVTFTPNSDGSVTIKGTATGWSSMVIDGDFSLPAGTYTLNSNTQTIDVGLSISKDVGGTQNIATSSTMSKTFTLPDLIKHYVAYIVVRPNSVVNTTIYPMLNLGESPLPYETYQGNVTPLPIPRPLRRVGDVKDKCVTRKEHEGAEKLVVTYNVGYIASYAGESITTAWISSTGALSTGAEVAYVLSSPEVYATDPLDIDNAAGPLTVMTGGEVEVRMTELIGSRSDVSNNTVAFSEASQDADIQTGEKLSVLFGKIKKRFSVVNKLVNGAVYPNLLDNSNFTNPVNQRNGSGTISASGYFIDRWKLVSGTVQITANGLVLNGIISQILENAVGTDVTASASAGTASYDNSTKTFTLTATGQTITWAKLEKGSVATPYVPKGYGAELSECLRYYYQVASVRTFGQQHTGAGTYVNIILPQVMRVTPTVSAPGEWTIRFNGMDKKATVSSVGSLNGNTLNLTMSTIAGGTYIGPLYAFYNDKITFSADL